MLPWQIMKSSRVQLVVSSKHLGWFFFFGCRTEFILHRVVYHSAAAW